MASATVSSLLDIHNLQVQFHTLAGTVRAVDGVDFALGQGETLGMVGESGCGKSVTALSILRLIPSPPGKISDGQVYFKGEDLLRASKDRIRQVRGGQISMIFQEPMTCLNPVFTIGHQIAETFMVHQKMNRMEAEGAATEILKTVQIPSPEKRVREYPHQLSGGMRQRVMIAMALACNPEILIADEPTTALDVTIQAQILDLMVKLKEELGTAIILITHDLGIIAEMAQRVIVMYAGKFVEEGEALTIFKEPFHPYTIGLLQSVPHLGHRSQFGKKRLQEIPGTVPGLDQLPPGCSFAPRCPQTMEICRKELPELQRLDETHRVACWLGQK
jgi:oligopeptide/dipeptide ABC transporter ATP-binding protein